MLLVVSRVYSRAAAAALYLFIFCLRTPTYVEIRRSHKTNESWIGCKSCSCLDIDIVCFEIPVRNKVFVLKIKCELDNVASMQADEYNKWILTVQSPDESDRREHVEVTRARNEELDGSR